MEDSEFRAKALEQLQRDLDRNPVGQRTLLLAAAALELQGQCRRQVPYADLRPVLDEDGLHWCCTHDPEHCSTMLVPPIT